MKRIGSVLKTKERDDDNFFLTVSYERAKFSNVFDEQLGLFQGGKVPAFGHFRALNDVAIAIRNQRLGNAQRLGGKIAQGNGNVNGASNVKKI